MTASTYQARRRTLADRLPAGDLCLFPANREAPMNYLHNTYPFRQDSTFRYLAGHNLPDLVLTVEAGGGESKLYGEDFTMDMIVWMGEQPRVRELAETCGAAYGGTLEQLRQDVCAFENIHYLPPYRASRREWLSELLGYPPSAPSEALVRAVVDLRSVKSGEELAEMSRAVRTSMQMHRAAREFAAPGRTEAEVAGLIEGIAIQAGGRLAYPAIVSKNGHILHNHYHGNTLSEGDLLLIDAGAETDSGYAGDITRTFAVGTELSDRQRAVYDIVDTAKTRSIGCLSPGIAFAEVHRIACTIITRGLKELGIMWGDPEEAVAAGAHALFMPHGLGHMIGLDVHDMEDLGEDLVGYDDEFRRSAQFGTRSLRLGRRLREGFALTVEPGIYFIPALIDQWRAGGTGKEFIDFEVLEQYRNFGGIRLEDNVAITRQGHKVLG